MTEREREVDEYFKKKCWSCSCTGQTDLAVCTLLFQPSVICHYILFKTRMEEALSKEL